MGSSVMPVIAITALSQL